MTNQAEKPCRSGCFGYEGHPTHFHAPDCPNANAPAPKPAEPPPHPNVRNYRYEPTPPPPVEPRIYPCDKCGKMRTKAEGGTVFTVCEACWDKVHPAPVEPGSEPTMSLERYLEKLKDERDAFERERDALAAQVLDLKRRLEMIESDHGGGANPTPQSSPSDR